MARIWIGLLVAIVGVSLVGEAVADPIAIAFKGVSTSRRIDETLGVTPLPTGTPLSGVVRFDSDALLGEEDVNFPASLVFEVGFVGIVEGTGRLNLFDDENFAGWFSDPEICAGGCDTIEFFFSGGDVAAANIRVVIIQFVDNTASALELPDASFLPPDLDLWEGRVIVDWLGSARLDGRIDHVELAPVPTEIAFEGVSTIRRFDETLDVAPPPIGTPLSGVLSFDSDALLGEEGVQFPATLAFEAGFVGIAKGTGQLNLFDDGSFAGRFGDPEICLGGCDTIEFLFSGGDVGAEDLRFVVIQFVDDTASALELPDASFLPPDLDLWEGQVIVDWIGSASLSGRIDHVELVPDHVELVPEASPSLLTAAALIVALWRSRRHA